MIYKVLSQVLREHSAVWWTATTIQLGVSCVYALYIDLKIFRTYGYLLSKNMTFTEHVVMRRVEEAAEDLALEPTTFSLYDRQSAMANIREMLGPIYMWVLPIPKSIRLELKQLEHMVVDPKALGEVRRLVTEVREHSPRIQQGLRMAKAKSSIS